MRPDDPVFWASAQIHKHLSKDTERMPGELARALDRLLNCQRSVQETWERLGKAHSHGLHLAARLVQRDLLDQAHRLNDELGQVFGSEGRCTGEQAVPTHSRSLVDDLRPAQDWSWTTWRSCHDAT